MGRPARFRTEDLVTAAIGLAARGGPSAVTMAALARETGAPSGSLYHRFSGRPALLASVWTHAVADFQDGCRRALAADPPSAAAEATARHVLAWSRARPDAARVLLHRPADFDEAHWPQGDRDLLRAGNAEIGTLLARLARELREPEESVEAALDRVRLAVVDLPLALVRRHLLQGTGVPAEAEDLAADASLRLLVPRTR
ncbi:TetR family transcriptional regulator [Nocardiopsis sp. Huas11]|uniref:TetR/AcrR family transcriptional regulator n=1 Tax=Nocardiopsis sp. Huas11 TaxID=2183912 RepID=UPI000EB09C82|nr:TetR/AcrR family transcriptional regulator [Nocardiopsis sp. Huas11]RKS09583.1 TetR family transcriptional regulator [Nocardiopsis sp. Huas11]